MTNTTKGGVASTLCRIPAFFGFSKVYNFILFFIFGGALFGFGLSRFMYIDIPGIDIPGIDIPGILCGPLPGENRAAPGECYYYENFDQYKVGIRLHLYTILPAALLVVPQFVPAIRYKAIIFHRINGYLLILLAVLSNAGALMIARKTMGGGIDIQAWIGLMAILTTGGLALALYNIKRLQIDQHRAWMIRTWFYFSTIITLRIIFEIATRVITMMGSYYSAQPCDKLNDIAASIAANGTEMLLAEFPACSAFLDGDLHAHAIVHVNFNGTAAQKMAAINMTFGMAGWVALAIHAFGVEVYLHLTPEESKRLRKVSYERQLKAGHKHPGDSGLGIATVPEHPRAGEFFAAGKDRWKTRREPVLRKWGLLWR